MPVHERVEELRDLLILAGTAPAQRGPQVGDGGQHAQGQCDGFWKGSRKGANLKCSEWRKWAEVQDWSGVAREIYP